MDKKLTLKNGLEIHIREMRKDDAQRSLDFFRALPDEDREYLRVDVTDPLIVEQRIKNIEAGRVVRLVAVFDEKIIADGALELEGFGWKKHIAEIRLIIAHDYQRKGLGLLMARELFRIAAEKKIEEIVVEFVEVQTAAKSIFERLGFHEDAKFPDFVKDRHGKKHDLIYMRCNLEELWKKLEHYLHESDWIRTR
ncbi:MAG: GNAT family N-acetyltransferase [candidate division Zixibacteria bacterium]|nr:GNAT family N-acetyltransferase [candidate division Zixibacteria bacterium]